MQDFVKSEAETEAPEASLGSCGCPSMPQVTFSTFILSLASSGLAHLGEVPCPDSGQMQPNLELARHTIEVLCMLRDKTKRCLDTSEARLLDDVLYELRIKYCAKTK